MVGGSQGGSWTGLLTLTVAIGTPSPLNEGGLSDGRQLNTRGKGRTWSKERFLIPAGSLGTRRGGRWASIPP